MEIRQIEKQNAIVLELNGNIMDGSCYENFKEVIKELIVQNKLNIVIDLGNVIHMNSMGLGMLISGYSSLKNAKGNLKLACITEKIESLLNVTKLITIFENYSTVEEAVSTY